MNTCVHLFADFFYNEKYFRQNFRENQNTHFMFLIFFPESHAANEI